MLVVYLHEEATINVYRVYNIFKLLHDYREESLTYETSVLEHHANKYFHYETNNHAKSKDTCARLLSYVRSCKKGRILYYKYFLVLRAMLLEDNKRTAVEELLNTIIQQWNTMITNTRGITITDNKKEERGNCEYAINCFNRHFRNLFNSFKQLASIMFNKNLSEVESFTNGNQSKHYPTLYMSYYIEKAFDFITIPEVEEIIMNEITDEIFNDMLELKEKIEFDKRFNEDIDTKIHEKYEEVKRTISDDKRMKLITQFMDQFGFILNDIVTNNIEEQFSEENGYNTRIKETIRALGKYVTAGLHN